MRRCNAPSGVTLAAVVLCTSFGTLWTAKGAVTVTINHSTEYQTIEGMGAFGGMNAGSGYTQAFIDRIVGDLGISMIRTDMGETTDPVSAWIDYLTKVQAKGRELGRPVRVICSTWSPPAYMKINGSVSGLDPTTNKLKPDMYDDYGRWVLQFQQQMRQGGVEVYAVSLQNEPAFPEPYWSCVYTPTEYRDMVKVAGPIIAAGIPGIKFFGAEDMLENWTANPYAGNLMADPTTRQLISALAVHGYRDGVHPTPASRASSLWSQAARNCASVGKPLWMTETSGYGGVNDWTGNFELAEMMYCALKFGKIAAWVWWSLSDAGGGAEALMDGDQPGLRYYVSKHFFRYIRPGAVMIEATSSNELLFSLAFNDKNARALTVVLINATGASQTVALSGTALPSLRMYLTTQTLRFSDQGTVNNAALSLPASSIATLYGTNYNPPVSAQQRSHEVYRKPVQAGVSFTPAKAYSLTGRRIATKSDNASIRQTVSTGVVILESEGGLPNAMLRLRGE